MADNATNEEPATDIWRKAITVTVIIVLALFGFSTFIIGLVHIGSCGNAMILPLMLAVNGVLWMLPVLLFLFINFATPRDEDLKCLYAFLHGLFILSLLFLFACTVYILVSASQIKSLDFLCSQTWIPPYSLFILVADWITMAVVLRLFCVHQLPPEKLPPIQFRHLKNLPPVPLAIPWNRHRVIRTY